MENSEPQADPYDIWKALQPQVVIVNNPMYFVKLKRETRSKLVAFFEYFKTFTERWFSHILLLFVLFLYGCFGAWIFMMIEGKAEVKYKEPVSYMIQDFKREFWYQARVIKRDRNAIYRLVELRMNEFERQLLENFKSGIEVEVEDVAWTFWDALFFCVTIFTTIGYGHVTLKTDLGRGFTMIYAFIGIPLVLMVLTDLGKLFTRGIKFSFLKIRRFCYAHGFRRVRQAGRTVSAYQTQYVSGAYNAIRRLSVPRRSKSKASSKESSVVKETTRSNDINLRLPSEDPESAFPMDTTRIYKTPIIYPGEMPSLISPSSGVVSSSPLPPPPVIISSNPTPPMTAYVESRPGSPITPETPAPFTVDDEFNLPVSLALFILVLYILLGSFIFTYTDEWRLFESFYFVYISMSTIGFGDYVPEDSLSMIASSIYMLFGLALTSMCINVIQERLAESFENAKVRIGAQLGLDVNTITGSGVNGTGGNGDPGRESKKESGKEVGFELKSADIGKSLRERRERRRSSERSNSDKSSDITSINTMRTPNDQLDKTSSEDDYSVKTSDL
ncbi:TWiK family of potassium channels protein 18-like [Panonychus citri]|uniref:TWiK family of potassium channels protein 18-like n=1 Tax=Panonychus citri TaxID=50023 RepID=UPI0023073465|nr:TWiK family of potassium channels protein 18-like [Panonychus citri]